MDLDKERLAKLLSMTGSGHDGEVLAAIRKANDLLRSHGKTWIDVLNASTAPATDNPAPESHATAPHSSSTADLRRPSSPSARYQSTVQYRDAFRREPILSRLLGYPFWIVLELLAAARPNAELNTRGPVLTTIFATSMLVGVASWIIIGYLLLIAGT